MRKSLVIKDIMTDLCSTKVARSTKQIESWSRIPQNSPNIVEPCRALFLLYVMMVIGERGHTNYIVRNDIQSTLVISNSKGLSETLRDIRTSTYQIFRIEEQIIRTTTFNKFI